MEKNDKSNIRREKRSFFFSLSEINIDISHKILFVCMIKKYHKQCSAILGGIAIAGIWIIRLFDYLYQKAIFTVYNIDDSYIVLNDNIFFQIVEGIGIVVLFSVFNYVFFSFIVGEEKKCNKKNRWKMICKALVWYACEEVGIIVASAIHFQRNIFDYMKELLYESKMNEKILLTVGLLVAGIALTSLGISMIYAWFKKEELQKTESNQTINLEEAEHSNKEIYIKSFNYIEEISKVLILTLMLAAMMTFLNTYFRESNRNSYKIILEEMDKSTTLGTDIFKFSDMDLYRIYIIAYENENKYILKKLKKEQGKIKIDRTYQKIISKDNIETYYVDNIYGIQYME